MTTYLYFDGDWRAAVTRDPLSIVPRFDGNTVCLVNYRDVRERQRFVAGTFGSEHWLWDTPDVFRFTAGSRELAGVELQMPYLSAYAEIHDLVPVLPAVRPGGLLADEERDFRHEMCTVLCRAPGDTLLVSLRDTDVLDKPLDACIGIAPDVAFLVQRGAVVGWSLTDPARYLTTPYTAPDPNPPSPATRRLLTECLDLITEPLIDEVRDRAPAAIARLRSADAALRAHPEDVHRANALLTFISDLMEDYGNSPASEAS
ncbi:hypothetical protein [Streptomyces sp. NRRL WC-3626]|uniref:hypothetical protein n=1 Tax=Streptomyces sp. NRRL WC-3626 TaxID=1463926 RepID=UPI000AF6A992|nr:hypothetical protein [Streptomyces sp. NRRL WC-3626]